MKSWIMVLAMSAFLSGCFYHHHHPHGCPPGQAKKGNCHHD